MKNYIKPLALATIVLAVTAGIGTSLVLKPQHGNVKAAAVAPTPAPSEFSYSGIEGQTALALLQAKSAAVTKGEGTNAFVTSINGRIADDAKKEFWAFYVNGVQAQVGAGSYVTKTGDQIRWHIETY
jgi:hypothetical protein